MCYLPINDQELCATIFRKLWRRRNSFIFEKKFVCPKQVLNNAQQQREKFQLANLPLHKKSGAPTEQPNLGRRKWTKPSSLQFKINWDAAINSNAKFLKNSARKPRVRRPCKTVQFCTVLQFCKRKRDSVNFLKLHFNFLIAVLSSSVHAQSH